MAETHTKKARPVLALSLPYLGEGAASYTLRIILRAGPGILCRWEQFDKKYLSQLLMRRSAYRIRDQIWDVYYRLNIRDAISFVDQVGQQFPGRPVAARQMVSRAGQ